MTAAPEIAGRLRQAGEYAAMLVQAGMVIGLGTGSTAGFATRHIAERLRTGDLADVIAIATSRAVAYEALALCIPLLADDIPRDIDLTIDGADEVDPQLNLIKGGGGALLREKIVAQASRRRIIVVDDSKLSPRLGTNWALPVEVLEFGMRAQTRFLDSIGAVVVPRMHGPEWFRTDQGNFILDCRFGPIDDPAALAALLGARAGIIEHGLFIGIADEMIVAGAHGLRHVWRDLIAPIGPPR